MADIAKLEADREANVAESGEISTEYEDALTSMTSREDLEAFLPRLLDSHIMGYQRNVLRLSGKASRSSKA